MATTGRVSDYDNELVNEPADDDLLDVTVKISTAPDVWQSQKMRYAEIKGSGVAIASDIVVTGNGTNIKASTGKAGGLPSYLNDFVIAQKDFFNENDYFLWQDENGIGYINAPSGKDLIFSIDNDTYMSLTDDNGGALLHDGIQACTKSSSVLVIGASIGTLNTQNTKVYIEGIGNTSGTSGLKVTSLNEDISLDVKDDNSVVIPNGSLTLQLGTGVNEIATGGDYSAATNNQIGTRLDVKTYVENKTDFQDDTFRIQDDVDDTKEIAFEASNITTSTTRTITMPDGDVDLGLIGGWYGSQTRIKIAPWDVVSYADRDGVYNDNNGGIVNDSVAKITTMITGVYIPAGYRATAFMINASANVAIELFESQIDDATAVSKGSGNANTEVNITNVDSTDTNYLSITIVEAGNDIYGGYITIEKI